MSSQPESMLRRLHQAQDLAAMVAGDPKMHALAMQAVFLLEDLYKKAVADRSPRPVTIEQKP